MKRLFIVMAFLLCLPLASYAASIGGAETQGQGRFAVGLDQEFVFDRYGKDVTRVVTDGTVTQDWKIQTEVDKMYRTMAKVGYGLLDNLDVYVRLGMASPDYAEKVDGTWTDSAGVPPEDAGTFTGSAKCKGDSAFAYGFGMKGTYGLANDWLVGCDLQYLRHKNDYKASSSLTVYDDAGTEMFQEQGEWKGKATFYEWHVAPYVAKKLGNFVPYLGVRYSDSRIEDKDEWGTKTKIKADDNFGVFAGTDWRLGEDWKLNLEGRFIDETAMSVGCTYRF